MLLTLFYTHQNFARLALKATPPSPFHCNLQGELQLQVIPHEAAPTKTCNGVLAIKWLNTVRPMETAVHASNDTAVQVITSAAMTAEQNPSAGADRKSPSAILVEICYYRGASAPDADDAHIPYGIEAGQGT